MNNTLKYFGILFILIVLAGAVIAGKTYFDIEKYQKEVEELLPSLLEIVSGTEKYSALGKYDSCPEKKSNQVVVIISDPVRASVELDCMFSNGQADVVAKLSKIDGEWEITKMRVSSHVFLPIFNKARNPTP